MLWGLKDSSTHSLSYCDTDKFMYCRCPVLTCFTFSQHEMRTLKRRVSQFMSHCDELIQFSSPSVQRVVSKDIFVS